MSKNLRVPLHVALNAWVEKAKRDPTLYRNRQVTEILLNAIGITPNLKRTLVLKGGTLMGLAFGSHRQTGDVDFSAIAEPEPFATELPTILNAALKVSAATLGYLDLTCIVQRMERRPRPHGFNQQPAPALQVTIGYAVRGTNEEERLQRGQAPHVLRIDISFRELVVHSSEIHFVDSSVSVLAYSLDEIIAEKFRALIQQTKRDRYRRQDVFDINWLIQHFDVDAEAMSAVLNALRAKSKSRDINPTRDSLGDPDIRNRAGMEWDTLKLEIGAEALPPFDDAYNRVLAFYRSLPW